MVNTVSVLAVLAAVGTASAGRNLGRAPANQAELAPSSGSLVKPLKFNQPLLVCNAYPSKSPVAVSKNGKVINKDLAFQECKYAETDVLAKDKVDFTIGEGAVEGTFEVGELPQTDSVLLLVLQKRDSHSPLMAFQSFAFPTNSGSTEAHVAVIDATSESSKAHLQIADKPAQGDVRRVEELSFNRVYALEQGAYDVSVLEAGQETPKDEVELLGKRDYVLLHTGGQELGARALVAFPRDQPRSGAAKPTVFAALSAVVVSMFFLA